jgi:hypothetical protein
VLHFSAYAVAGMCRPLQLHVLLASSLMTQLQWSFVNVTQEVSKLQRYVAWRFDMSHLQLWAMNLTQAGLYAYTVKYHNPSGVYDTILVLEDG